MGKKIFIINYKKCLFNIQLVFESQQRVGIFSLPLNLDWFWVPPTHPPNHWVPGHVTGGGGGKVAGVKYVWSYVSIPLYAFMVCGA
jgi:hypothetical protein